MISRYLKARVQSIGYALKGIAVMVRTQPNAQLHLLATVAALVIAYLLHLRRWEWVAILLCIGLVWVAEALNTAIEFLADEVTREQRPGIGKAKDAAAGGVLIAAMISLLVGLLVFLNHLLPLLQK